MKSIYRIVMALGMVLSYASASWAQITQQGAVFDSNFSLVFDPATGDVSIEFLPNVNPIVSRIKIQSGSGLLIPGARNIPSFSSPPVFVNGVANGPGSTHLLDIYRLGSDIFATGWSLGPIISNTSTPTFGQLLSDLIIEWAPASYGLTTTISGDLLYGTFGNTQGNPVLPGNQSNGVWQFTAAPSGQFFDPPMAHGYLYEMTDSSLFTSVGLPVGLGSNFTITSSEGTVSGVDEGNLHTFTSGVSSFTITGINPLVDQDSPTAFPVFLTFSNSTANFNMTPLLVPEPSSLLLTLSLLSFVLRRGRA